MTEKFSKGPHKFTQWKITNPRKLVRSTISIHVNITYNWYFPDFPLTQAFDPLSNLPKGRTIPAIPKERNSQSTITAFELQLVSTRPNPTETSPIHVTFMWN